MLYQLLQLTLIILVIFICLYYVHNMLKNNKSNRLYKIMKDEGISYEQAKDKLINERIGELFQIDKISYEVDNKVIRQGNRISFDSEYGYITGEFIGLKESKAEGYTYHYILKNYDNKILSAPVETIYIDTLTIYER